MEKSKTKPSIRISFFESTNPEVFKIKPRAGGILPINKTEVERKQSCCPALQEKISREFRVQKALEESMSACSFIEEPSLPNPLRDSMYMLSVVVSTIVLLASNFANIPHVYLEWTEDYLECIRDENGHHPPNVQGILNHLKKLKDEAGTGTDGGDGGNGGGATEVVQQVEQFDQTGAAEADKGGDAGETGEARAGGEADQEGGEGGKGGEEGGEKTIVSTTRLRLSGEAGAESEEP